MGFQIKGSFKKPVFKELDFAKIERENLSKESNKKFVEALNHYLTQALGEERAADTMKIFSKKKIKISNQKTFFREDVRANYDIGSEAYKDNFKIIDYYMTEVVRLIQKELNSGRTSIDLTSIFVYLMQFKADLRKPSDHANEKINSLVSTLAGLTITTGTDNPFYVNIIPPSIVHEILEEFNLSTMTGYWKAMDYYFTALYRIQKENNIPKSCMPEIRFVFPIYEDVRGNQITLLRRTFELTVKETKSFIKDIEDLGEDTPQLTQALEEMAAFKNRESMNIDKLKEKLKKIKEEHKLFTYDSLKHSERRNILRAGYLTFEYIDKIGYKNLYIEKSSFIKGCFKKFLEAKINCLGIEEFEELEPLIGGVAQILMAGSRHASSIRNLIASSSEAYLEICLVNVGVLTSSFIKKVRKKEKELTSIFNKPFKITIMYEEKVARGLYGLPYPMFLRVISDIHADINKEYNYLFDFGSDFVINCGDTSGDCFTTRDWIKTFMDEGVSVTGNHLGYTDLGDKAERRTLAGYPYNIQPKNGQQRLLETTFDNTRTPVLSNSEYEFEGMIFLGTTLYTDFNLFGTFNKAACMAEAASRINDFRYCKYFKKAKGKSEVRGEIVPFTPSIQSDLFKVCVGWLRNRMRYHRRNNPDKPIIIVTHHVPTPYGVKSEYKNDPLSAAFASDLRWFLEENPEVRLWAYGHTHWPHQYIIENCRFVCHPFGYFNENNFDVSNYGLRIPITHIKSKKPWQELLQKEIEKGEIKVYPLK